jgi:hypothetical protein
VPKLARGYSAWPDGLRCAVGQKAGWATAWQPSSAAEADRVLRARRVRCGMVTARNPHAGRRGGVLVGGPEAASRQQGLMLEYHG